MTWSGLRDAKPKRGGKSGLRGDRAPSDVVLCKCKGRKIEGAERDPNSCPLFFFFFFFLIHVLLVKVQELACTVRYGVKKTILLAPEKKPSTQVPLVWNQPHTSHVKKEILLPLAKAVRKEKSIKHMGRNQQENPCHRLPNRNKIKPVIHRKERKVTTKTKPQKEIQNNFQRGPIKMA